MRVFGIDYGDARIGLAIGDTILKIASPYEVIKNKGIDSFIETLQDFIQQEDVELLVIGLPVNMNGNDTDQTRNIQKFIEQLKATLSIGIITEDERLTSRYAEGLLKNTHMSGKKSDDVAAMIILQSYFDRI